MADQQVRFGEILKGQDFLRSYSDTVVWRRTRGAFAIRVDLIGQGKGSWPVSDVELVTPPAKKPVKGETAEHRPVIGASAVPGRGFRRHSKGQYMKKIFAVALMFSAGVVHAELPPGMPASATAMTSRDNCFQYLRGHVDLSAQKRGYQVLRMIEGYGAEVENGDFKCAAKFELGTADGNGEKTPWHAAMIFAHGQQPEAK